MSCHNFARVDIQGRQVGELAAGCIGAGQVIAMADNGFGLGRVDDVHEDFLGWVRLSSLTLIAQPMIGIATARTSPVPSLGKYRWKSSHLMHSTRGVRIPRIKPYSMVTIKTLAQLLMT